MNMKKLLLILAVFQTVLLNAQEVRYRMNLSEYLPPYSDKKQEKEIITRSVFNTLQLKKYHALKPFGKYKKVAIWPGSLLSYSAYLEPYKAWHQYYSEGGTQSNEKKYLYRASVVCDGKGIAPDTAKIILFFSSIDCGKGTGKLKKVAEDLNSRQIVLKEMLLIDNPPQTNIYSKSDIQKPVYPTKVYTYTLGSINPREGAQAELISLLNTFMQNDDSDIFTHYYKESTEVIYEKGKIKNYIDVYFNDSGQRLPFSRITQYDPATGKEKSIAFQMNEFNTSIGVDLITNKLIYEEDFSSKVLLGEEGKDIKLLESIQKGVPLQQVFDEKMAIDFVLNLKKYDEMIFINPFNKADNIDKFIYTGTFKNNVPDGWGLMYLQNEYHPAYYFGAFKNGVPDGFGFRFEMAVDQDTLVATPMQINYNNVPYSTRNFATAGLHTQNKLLYGFLKSQLANLNGSTSITYRASFGDFRTGKLSGEGLDCFVHIAGPHTPYYFAYYKGTMKEGMLNGNGAFISPNTNKSGVFKDGIFVSGNIETNKIHYEVGRVIRIDGKRYVIMSKNTTNNTFKLDDGRTISSKDPRIEFTYQISMEKSNSCSLCNGTGWYTESWSNTYSGTTQTQKSYHTGPTGYIVWEKTTTTTTAPITVNSSRSKKCGCGGMVSYKGPKPLQESER
jgi:hypothetical protein